MAADFLLQGETISRLLVGLSVTLRISLVSVALSLPMGVLMGVLFTRRNPLLRAVLRVYLEFIRVMPQLVLPSFASSCRRPCAGFCRRASTS